MSKLMTPTQYANEIKFASRQTVLRAIKKGKKNQLPRVVDITEIKAGDTIRYILHVS